MTAAAATATVAATGDDKNDDSKAATGDGSSGNNSNALSTWVSTKIEINGAFGISTIKAPRVTITPKET